MFEVITTDGQVADVIDDLQTAVGEARRLGGQVIDGQTNKRVAGPFVAPEADQEIVQPPEFTVQEPVLAQPPVQQVTQVPFVDAGTNAAPTVGQEIDAELAALQSSYAEGLHESVPATSVEEDWSEMIDTFAVAQIAAQLLAGAIPSPQYIGVAADDRYVLAAVQAAHKIIAVAADPSAAEIATSMPPANNPAAAPVAQPSQGMQPITAQQQAAQHALPGRSALPSVHVDDRGNVRPYKKVVRGGRTVLIR